MSDRIRPMPFIELLSQAMTEYKEKGSMFYVLFTKPEHFSNRVILSGKQVEAPVGPAAGPHTQLAQNIIAAYAGGARYFELKTVQVLHGEELGIQKPCIYVNGEEAYNTEWSSELTANQALEEYIKAWFILKLLIKEFELGDEDGFVFNMSVGYSLGGIQSDIIDYFLESMKDASSTGIFRECIRDTLSVLDRFTKVSKEYVEHMDPKVCNTVSLSTMHGCPVGEIERIAAHLLINKKLNTYLKCNPTLLGYDEIKTILENMGYGYMAFPAEMFKKDLSFEEAVTLIKRLQAIAKEHKLEFGVKLTNTFPVYIREKELTGDMMYMSGPSLYPLTIGVAAKLAEVLGDDLRISYSGGADPQNIGAIYETGIYPITVSTYLLKPGGYKNINKLNKAILGHEPKMDNLDIEAIKALAASSRVDKNYYKSTVRKKRERKTGDALLCTKCNNCVDTCPNRANIPIQAGNNRYILHLDAFCNECGNCSGFCPSGYQPYQEKYTIFQTKKDLEESNNPGIFCDEDEILRLGSKIFILNSENDRGSIPSHILQLNEVLKGRKQNE